MGAISIGLPRGSITARLDGMVFHNGQWPVVCFLYHCYGLSINSADDDATICPGSEIRKDPGICICRGIRLMPTENPNGGVFFGTDIAAKKGVHGIYGKL